jgi:cytolysin-activating lysine-acyltransferase
MESNETKTEHVSDGLIALANMNPYEAFWDFCKICIDSNSNTNWSIADISRLFVQPIVHGNYRVFYKLDKGERIPSAFCTWAWLSDEAAKKVGVEFLDPRPDEWNSGKNLWIIDLVSTNGDTNKIARHLQNSVFFGLGKGWVHALRRSDDGKVDKIAKWPFRN